MPPLIVDITASLFLVKGQKTELRCSASGLPTPNVTWIRLGVELIERHLARSGSQSDHRIRRILPARGACHIYSLRHRKCGARGYMHELFVSKTRTSEVRASEGF